MNRWQRVHALFERALTLDDGARDALLRDVESEDPTWARAVRALLTADRDAGDFLADQTALAAGDGEWPDEIGPYRLLRRLGQGGMSTVYLARRIDGPQREVALKVIRRDMVSGAAKRRLRAEREILGHLDHPAIARLLDGGTTEQGLPYVVMEYIEGIPIDAHADRQALPIEARVRLFLEVLDAVHDAHQNLVVHRDLKPSNILVTRDGQPKLLDFGISKVLNARLAGHDDEATATGQRLMTPSYASPEQIAGAPITTASDIYSLGVLLFKLLTGEVPDTTRGRTAAEVTRASNAAPPPRASVVASRVEAAEALARARTRGTTPKQLRDTLVGDLDAILAQALHAAPRRRYGSVEQLAEDLRRYLDGRPVRARPDTFGYRAGKLIRRHAKALVAGAVSALILAALLVALAIQNRDLVAERDQVARQRDTTARVLTFTERLLGLADPALAGGVQWTVVDALHGAEQLITDELAAAPDVQAQLHGTVGRIFRGLGETEPAIEHLAQALALRRQLDGPTSLATAQALSDLAAAWVASGDFARGEALALEAVGLFRRRSAMRDPRSVPALNTYVYALCADGGFDDARATSEEALTLARQLLDPRDPVRAQAMHNRAHVLGQEGALDDAEQLYREVLALRRETLRAPHPAIASTLVNLAANLSRQQQHVEAERLYELALAQHRQLFGERHPNLAPVLNNLAVVYQAREQWARAADAYRQAIDLFPDGDVQHLRLRIELAALLDRTGDAAGAEAMLRRELVYWRSKLDPGNTLVAWAENTLGAVLTGQRRWAEAESLLTRSVPLIRERKGPGDAYTLKAEKRLAQLRAAIDDGAG